MAMSDQEKIYAYIDYQDKYVQPLILAALKSRLPRELLVLIDDTRALPSTPVRSLQWRQYEEIDFDQLLANPTTCLANSYIIRKALIRKHYLSVTVSHWLTKQQSSILREHVQPSIEFEVDYAEFLDEALVEAFELKASWDRNEGNEDGPKEWWILKPGMSERGQGIRLFSSEQELTDIFEEWDPDSEDEEEGGDGDDSVVEPQAEKYEGSSGIITSQLRHFVAQPYIDPPLLMPAPHPSAGRKFHIRTYVLAIGALQVYVYRQMLALFASQPYGAPVPNVSPNDNLAPHLTNTCLQSGERDGSVEAFWSLPATLSSIPDRVDWKEDVFSQICAITGEVFEAAARSMSVHFQLLPNAFEIFGIDFLLDERGQAWLLEVNAFPDFAQTGNDLTALLQGLFEGVVDVGIRPFFGLESKSASGTSDKLVKVLDIDTGRH